MCSPTRPLADLSAGIVASPRLREAEAREKDPALARPTGCPDSTRATQVVSEANGRRARDRRHMGK
jgi:hypothetical protein